MPRGGARPGAGRKKRTDKPREAAGSSVAGLNAAVEKTVSRDGLNRSGRKPGVPNKATQSLKALAQQYTEEAVEGLVSLARAMLTPAAVKVSAWREVIDRGHGKPKEFHDITLTEKPDLSKLTDQELAVLEQLVTKATPPSEAVH